MNLDIKQIRNLTVKEACKVAATSNITLSGAQTIDGVSVVAGDRVLVTGQTTGSANGIYLASATSWSRALDANTTGDLLPNTLIAIQEGTVNGDKVFMITNDGTITIGTTAITFTTIGDIATATTANQGMTASNTSADGDEACATGIVFTPKSDGAVFVFVNGNRIDTVGDGVKTTACYFSGDGGTTARSIANITSGDKLYWNGSIAGYQLSSATDKISFDYSV